MNVFLENFDNNSDSGPNGFTRKLFRQLVSEEKVQITDYIQADMSFCLIEERVQKSKPRIQRLDGIYFNIDQDYQSLNNLIRLTYNSADAVIFQTEFNRSLIETWFGKHQNGNVIRNGTDCDRIESIQPAVHLIFDQFSQIWTCAAAWRPHKRLNENIRYFLDFAPQDSALVVMGKDAETWLINHPRIFYVGHVSWEQQISICRRASTFLHLAWLDHCPNVVVDAVASGCNVVCTTSGGTKEIAGKGAMLVHDDEWDFKPLRLYHPPTLDFGKITKNDFSAKIRIQDVANDYYNVMKKVSK